MNNLEVSENMVNSLRRQTKTQLGQGNQEEWNIEAVAVVGYENTETVWFHGIFEIFQNRTRTRQIEWHFLA